MRHSIDGKCGMQRIPCAEMSTDGIAVEIKFKNDLTTPHVDRV